MSLCVAKRGLAVVLALALMGTTWACGASAERVTVMTYNVQNFFDAYDDPYSEDSDRPKNAAAIRDIARAIQAADADVIAFQEIERPELLQAMVDQHLADAGYAYVAVSYTNSDRGIQLGVVSRLPIDRIASYRHRALTHPGFERSFRFARDLMHVTLEVSDGEKLELLNVHLKSNRTVNDDDRYSMGWRTAEAREVRRVARDLMADGAGYVVVLGDFNSDFEKRPGDERDWPATAHLRAAHPEHGLVDLHDALSREERITLPGRGRYPPAVFDFVLASPALAARVVEGSAKVLQDRAFADGSDHRPVVASFDLSERWAAPPDDTQP
ncbi:MAG: endonuclease/exonuclease/phosphatase family protein [Planctomycetota bacterium]